MTGPFDVECLHNLWIGAGCTDEGYGNPYNMTAFQLSFLNQLTMT